MTTGREPPEGPGEVSTDLIGDEPDTKPKPEDGVLVDDLIDEGHPVEREHGEAEGL